jgi:hypothetical protein
MIWLSFAMEKVPLALMSVMWVTAAMLSMAMACVAVMGGPCL